MIKDKNLKSYLFQVFFTFILLILLFGRSFVGIYLFKFRIGEYLVASSLFLTFTVFFCYFFFSDVFTKIIKIIQIHFVIVVSFFLTTFLTNSSLMSSYTYKSSSYIWTLGFLYLGFYFFRDMKLTIIHLNILFFVSLLVYINSVTIFYGSDFLVEFFTNNSDKLESAKGADLVMVFVVATFFSLKRLPYKRLTIDIFILLSALYLPLIMWKSKGAFLGLITYILFQLISNRQYLKKSLYRNLVITAISIVIFFLSSLAVVRGSTIDYAYDEVIYVVANRKSLTKSDWLLFYIEDGRIYSYDGHADWRLQIWQDVIEDSINDKTYFYGLGYQDIIPAMEDPNRQGWDGKNENVHNFLINNYARGGLIHLFLYIYLFWIFLFKYKENDKSMLIFTLPFFVTSLFGAPMENAHFPIVFYFFLGSLFSDSLD